MNDQYAPAAKFLGTAKVDRNPFHVTYVVNPRMDFAADGIVANHAYWLSGLRLRDPSGPAPLGKIDALSKAFGKRDAIAKATQHTAGALTGGNLGPLTYAETSKAWGPTRAAPKRDELDLTATNLSHAEVNVKRARLTCRANLEVKTDGPLTLRLAACGRTLHFG